MKYPWQQANWHNLSTSLNNNQLAHALLFHGASGTGKRDFAHHFAHWLLCEQPDSEQACGQCKACQLLQAESNPDFLQLSPEGDSREIKVDQVRALIDKLALTQHSTGTRVVIISPADAMNISASNSLLKTLEEPSPGTILLLVTDRPSALSATIRSRCQQIRFDLPAKELALQWMTQQQLDNPELLYRLSAGAPLAARALAEEDGLQIRQQLFENWQQLAQGKVDPVTSADMWLKTGFRNKDRLPLYWVSSWIIDMIRSLQGAGIESMDNVDYAKNLHQMALQTDLKALYDLYDRVNETLRMSESPVNLLNLVEGLLIIWSGLKRRAA